MRRFYTVAKSAEAFGFSDEITREEAASFLETLGALFGGEGRVFLRVASECLLIDETRLRFDFEGFAAFKYVIDAMKSRGLGAIVFRRDVDEKALQRFLGVFIENDDRVDDPYLRIITGLREADVASITVEEMSALAERDAGMGTSRDSRETSVTTYFKSIFVAKHFMANLRGRRATYFRKAQRVVQSIVDLVTKDEATLNTLTRIKDFDESLFTHSANVCVLSVALGQSLDLPKDLLAQLGLAALLHDVGMTRIPREILHREKMLNPEERELYELHPGSGAIAILKSQGFHDAAIRCATVSLHHHGRQEDGDDPPAPGAYRRKDLLSAIVAIADTFDKMTTPGVKGESHLTAEEALYSLLHDGRDLDPVLVKTFVNTVDIYPLGSMVRLDSGEIGFVHSRNSAREHLFHPTVRVTHGPDGEAVPPHIVDLSERDPVTAAHLREITEVLPASDYIERANEFPSVLP